MLAATIEDLSTLDIRSPLLLSPKIDGVRGIFMNGMLMSRAMKIIPNQKLQHLVSKLYAQEGQALENLDCEITMGDPTAEDCYRKTTSTVMSHNADIEGVQFLVFDRACEGAYAQRLRTLFHLPDCFLKVPQTLTDSHEQISRWHDTYAQEGYEGVILRCPNAPYKNGRSTLKERYLLKYKKFTDDEAQVIGFEELMTNNNTQEKNELGYSKRSSKKANLAGANTLGALIVRYDGQEFKIGTGFTQADRDHIWQNRCAYLGMLVKFKYFAVGVKDLPRHPVWLGFRNKMDMS